MIPITEKPASPGKLETILVVEDELSLRKLTCNFLGRKSYTVLEASNAKEALKLCEEFDGPIHLLVTDVVMPGMDGPDLATSLLRGRSEMKVLYMSGYMDHSLERVSKTEIKETFLQKPFTLDALHSKVREILAS